MNKSYTKAGTNTSADTARNIYKTARLTSGLTQERAAELLNVSVETLRAYETNRRIPANEIVAFMVDLYMCPVLAVQHLRESSELARNILPDAEQISLERASIRLYRLVRKFMERHRVNDLLDIAEDGIIDEKERPKFNEIMDELKEMCSAVLSLQILK